MQGKKNCSKIRIIEKACKKKVKWIKEKGDGYKFCTCMKQINMKCLFIVE
jgi:hypothetical protein